MFDHYGSSVREKEREREEIFNQSTSDLKFIYLYPLPAPLYLDSFWPLTTSHHLSNLDQSY